MSSTATKSRRCPPPRSARDVPLAPKVEPARAYESDRTRNPDARESATHPEHRARRGDGEDQERRWGAS